MKKTIAALLVLCCLCACVSALADDAFSFRDGIRFGDSESDVERKETWRRIPGNHFFTHEGTVEGEPAMVVYRCPENVGLRSILYAIGASYGSYGLTRYADTDDSYGRMQKLLSVFFGKGEESRTESCTDILMAMYTSWLSSTAGDSISDIDSFDFRRQTSWKVPVDGGTVYICLQSHLVRQDGCDRYLTLLDFRIGYDGEFMEWLLQQH